METKLEQLHRAEEEYLTLLQLPWGRLRSSMQRKLCELRDYIAEHTMRGAEEVQNEFTERAFVRSAGENLKKQLDGALLRIDQEINSGVAVFPGHREDHEQ